MKKIKMHKMDNIDETSAEYKKIYKWSVIIFGILAFVYYYFKAQEIVGQNFIALLFFQVISLSFIAFISYLLCSFIGHKIWIHKNKNIYVKGTWLHMHIKGGGITRIGYVDIKQSFYTISATGQNIQFDINGNYDRDKDSDWKYYMGKVRNDSSPRDYIGCYAKEGSNGNQNDGLHEMTIKTDIDGWPNRIYGNFMDTFAVHKKEIENADNHRGKLLMFKLTKPCRDYLYDKDGFSNERLARIFMEDSLKDELFVKELNKEIKKSENSIF